MKQLLQQLTQIPAPSGYEHKIRDAIREMVADYADEITTDALGNLIVRKGKAGQGKRIMLAAHMDEIGVMVSHIDENGFARFAPIGGVYPPYCLGGRVRFLNGHVGVINSENTSDPNKIPSLDQLFIDLGGTKHGIKVGDVAAFDRSFADLGDRVVSKALDDRVGVAVLISALRQLESTPHEIYFVFSVQEEVGVRGATTAAFQIAPDVGIAVDVTGWGDTPKVPPMVDVALGKGPAIKIRDSGMLADPRVVDWMISTAEKAKIPYQREVLLRGSTDARAIQLSRAGVPAGTISIPCRYVHSPSEMIDVRDAENAVALITALLSEEITWA